MQNGRMIAAGVALGYLLGRTKKMKLAMMLGAAAMGSRLDLKSLAKKGTALLEASPGAQRLTSEISNRVGATGKAAVAAVAGKGMDALSDNLRSRTDRLRGGGKGSDEEEPDEAEPETEEADEAEDEPEPQPKRSRRRASSGSGSGSSGNSSSRSSGNSSSRAKKSSSTTRKRTSSTAKRGSGSGTRQRRSRTNG